MNYISALGVLGAATILAGFLLIKTKKVTSESRTYDVINIVGSLFLITYAILLDAYPFIILNTVWILASLRSLCKSFKSS